MSSQILPIGIQACIDETHPLYEQFVRHAKKKHNAIEYIFCDFCEHPLEESGMRVRGQLVISAKTCRNPLCPMCNDTLNPQSHQQACAKYKGKRND